MVLFNPKLQKYFTDTEKLTDVLRERGARPLCVHSTRTNGNRRKLWQVKFWSDNKKQFLA